MDERTKSMFISAVRIIKKYRNGRELVFLGSGDEFEGFLNNEHKITVSKYATDVKKKAVEGRLLLDDMKGTADKNYIVIPMTRSNPTLRKRLRGLGFALNRDYIFVHRSNTVIKPNSPDFRDEYGNFVHSGGCRVVIGRNVENSYVYVGDNFKSDGDCLIRLFGGGKSRVEIGKNCKSNGNVKFFVYGGGELTIGDEMKVSRDASISVMDNNRVNIGRECMISYEVKMFSGDGHAIFNSETGERTNVYEPGTSKGVIEIGDHCWLCIRSIILNKTILGDSCIVGAGSVVKGTYPAYSAIAGNPAKKVKDNVTWNRNFHATSMNSSSSDEDDEDNEDASDSSEE